MAKSAKKSKTPKLAARTSGKSLASHIRPPLECAKMLDKLAKSKAGLPNMATRANNRMVVIAVNGKPARINPNFIGGMFGLVHRLTPYAGKSFAAVNGDQQTLASEGKLYHYRTLLIALAKAGYKISLSKDTSDQYVADQMKAVVKAAKAGTK